MITIGANGQKISYGIKHYNVDTEADKENLPTKNGQMGDTCFVIKTSKYYMLNGESEWIEISPYGNTASSEGNIPSGDVIYDGGQI